MRVATSTILVSAFVTLATTAFGESGRFDTIPNACDHLTEPLAIRLLGQDKVRAEGNNEHIETFYSQCYYSGKERAGFKAGIIYKFMVKEMFDLDSQPPEMIDFAVGFATGGKPAAEKLPSPGRVTYVFEDRDLTYLFMIPWIGGPDLSGPSTLVANYQLTNPDLTHEQRRDLLLTEARKDAERWLGAP